MFKERILISGASGFIGRNLIPHLNSYSICVLTRNEEEFKDTNVTVLNSSNLNEELSSQIKSFNPTIIIHLAGDSTMSRSISSINSLIHANVYLGVFLLEVASSCSTHSFINTTSSLIFEHGIISLKSLYACSKKSFIDFTTYYSSISTLRIVHSVLYNVYGPGDQNMRAINYVLKSIDTPVDMSPGFQELDLIHIDDVVEFYISLIKNIESVASQTYFHIGTGIPTSLRDLASEIEKIALNKCQINWGGISYRENEKMTNVSPKIDYGFWKPKIGISEGLNSMITKN